VKDQAQEGGLLIQRLLQNQFDVSAACWLLSSEKDDWRLYIVSKNVDEKGRSQAHQELEAAFEQLPELWMDRSEVRLVGTTDRVAQEIAAIQGRVPVKLKNTFHIKLGGLTSAEIHIYPLPLPSPPWGVNGA